MGNADEQVIHVSKNKSSEKCQNYEVNLTNVGFRHTDFEMAKR